MTWERKTGRGCASGVSSKYKRVKKRVKESCFKFRLTVGICNMQRILSVGLVVARVAHYLGAEECSLEMVCGELREHFNDRLRLEIHILHKNDMCEDRLADRTEEPLWQWIRTAPLRWKYTYFPSWELERCYEQSDDQTLSLNSWSCDY